MTERTKSWLPWIALVLNVGTIIVGLSTSDARRAAQTDKIGEAVSELKGSIDGQNQKLGRIDESLNQLKTSAAVSARDLSSQNDKLKELEDRIHTAEQRLQQQGERLARRGI